MAEFGGRIGESMPVQEHLLLDYAQRLEHRRRNHRAVHVHLSKLKPYHRRSHHVRIAAKLFEDLIKLHDGQLFVLGNTDLVFLWRGAGEGDIQPAVETLRFLFREDPLAQEEQGGFATWYRLDTDYAAFLETADGLYRSERRRASRGEPTALEEVEEEAGRNIAPGQLTELEKMIRQGDLARFVRWQPVCALVPGMPPQPVFQELYVAIGEFQRQRMPGYNLAGNPWLFRELTMALDTRVMALLLNGETPIPSTSISLNFNLETVLADGFAGFAGELREKWQGRVVIELNMIDVMAKLGLLPEARDRIRAHGFRVLLDGLTHLSLPFMDRERLKMDLFKMAWSADMAETVHGARLKDLEAAVHDGGRERMILSRCDSDVAVKFGRLLGITLFQGRRVDAILAEAQAKAGG